MNDIDALLDQALTVKNTTKEIQYVEIDPSKRIVETKSLLLGVESDEKAERIYFKMPRIVGDEIDLMDNRYKLFINYENSEGVRDSYWVTDRELDGDKITFSWLLSRLSTQFNGTVKFSLCVKKVQMDGILTNEWNTTIAKGEVLDGLETFDVITEYCSDVITQLVTKVDELNTDVDTLKKDVNSLENAVSVNEIGNRNLLRSEWLTTYQNIECGDKYKCLPEKHFIDKLHYALDGTASYVKTALAGSQMGFYFDNIKGMLPSTRYVVSFKARKKEGHRINFGIYNICVVKGIDHVNTSWYFDKRKVGSFGVDLLSTSTDGPSNIMDDTKWHDFRLEFQTSANPKLFAEDGDVIDKIGDVIKFNTIEDDPWLSTSLCGIDISELQWKTIDNYPSEWSRPPEDACCIDLKQLCNPNRVSLNLLKENWLTFEQPTDTSFLDYYFDKSHYEINRSFTYGKLQVISDGVRITHIDAMKPNTRYFIYFKMKHVHGDILDFKVKRNYNHVDMSLYLDGVKVNDINKETDIDLTDGKYHDVLFEFTTATRIEPIYQGLYKYYGDVLSFNNSTTDIGTVNIVDFIWADVKYNETLYESLIFNRYILDNQNLLRDEWLTPCQVEV